MNNQKKQPQELVPCPGCLGTKVEGRALCYSCKKQYVTEAADAALSGNPVPTYEDWIQDRVRDRIPALEMDLKTAQENLSATNKKAEEKLLQLLQERTGNQKLSPPIFEAAKAKLREKEGAGIWKSLGGDAIYRKVKVAETRLQEARRLLKDLGAKKTPAALLEYGEQILQQRK